MAGSRFRARKLGVKQNLTVLREADIDLHAGGESGERHEPLASLPKLETGVDTKEEKVSHHVAPAYKNHVSTS